MSTVSRMKVKPQRSNGTLDEPGAVIGWMVFTAADSMVHWAATQPEAMTWAYEFAALQGWTK